MTSYRVTESQEQVHLILTGESRIEAAQRRPLSVLRVSHSHATRHLAKSLVPAKQVIHSVGPCRSPEILFILPIPVQSSPVHAGAGPSLALERPEEL